MTKPNLASDEEFIIFSSEKCGENDPECGFSYGPAHSKFIFLGSAAFDTD